MKKKMLSCLAVFVILMGARSVSVIFNNLDMEIILFYVIVAVLVLLALMYQAIRSVLRGSVSYLAIDMANIYRGSWEVKESRGAPPGIPGLARATMALTVIVMAILVVGGLIVTASGEPVVIDFEDLSTSGSGQGGQIEVSTQYENKGIIFNSPVVLDYSKGLAIPDFAHSGTKAIEQCYAKEFCTTPIKMNFTLPQSRVKVWVGYSAGIYENRTVFLITYDKDHKYLDKDWEILALSGEPLPIQIPLEVTSESANIMYAEVNCGLHQMNNLAIDDVEFMGECDNPPTVHFDKPTYCEGDMIHATVSAPHRPNLLNSYEIKDCSDQLQFSGGSIDGSTIKHRIPRGRLSSCCNWSICFSWNVSWDEGLYLCGPECYDFEVCPDLKPDLKPDLIVEEITWNPSNPEIEQSVTFTVKIKNNGDADAESSHVRLYIRNIEVEPASAPVGPIAAGSTVSKSFTWTADSCAKTAVSVIADADNEVEESREDNNYLLGTIYVKCPDLEITNISWSPEGDDLHAGDDVTISYKIRNNGDVDAKDFKTSILIDSLPFCAFTQSLSANTEKTEECRWKAVKGTHRIKVEADAQKKVEESDETNNEYRADIVVDEKPVDLLITGIEVTQAIQNLDGDVPLIEGKDTFVRVYLKTKSRSISNVKGTLKCFRNSKQIGEIQNLNTWNYIAKDSGKERPSIDERRSDDFYLLLFKLPDEWLSGDITIKVEIEESDPRYKLEQLCSCTPCERKLQFNNVDKITIAFVPIHHKQSNTKPAFGDIAKVFSDFIKLYPISRDDVSIEIWPPLEIDYNPTNNDSTNCSAAGSESGNCGLRLLGDIQFLASYQTRRNNDQKLIVYGLVDSEVKSKAANHGPLWGYGEMGNGKTIGTRCAWGISGTFGGSYMAHGIGHNLGRKHVNCGGPKNIDEKWPYHPEDECHLAPETPAGFWGFDVNERSVRAPSEYSDFMTYSAPYWVSNYTYAALFEFIKSSSQSSLNVMSKQQKIDMILISGFINISANNATFNDFFQINGTLQSSESMLKYRIEIQLRNTSSGNVLVNHSFNISNADGSDNFYFTELVKYNASTDCIVLKNNNTKLASRTVSGWPPKVTDVTVEQHPNGDTAIIKWIATDPDEDTLLHYCVQYSPDKGSTWSGIAQDLKQDHTATTDKHQLDTSDLAGSEVGLIRVTVADGVYTRSNISDTFNVSKKGPKVNITQPANGTLVTIGSNITFSGAGDDPEDGTLNDSNLTWSSNINDKLVIGKRLQTRFLSKGEHTITLMGKDSDGHNASDSITISVIDYATIDKTMVMLSATAGAIVDASLVDELLLSPLPDVEFPFGVFAFNISALDDNGQTTVTITLPQKLPSDAKYWMYGGTNDNAHWYDIPMETNEDDRTVTISLTDNGKGDADIKKNGTIVVVGAPGVPLIFDTKAPDKPYPSVSGTHTGTITPIRDVNISQLYTYPCAGTGGHTKSIEIYENGGLKASGTWNGYQKDWQNIALTQSVTLKAGEEYNYVIKTGSYPQIHHTGSLLTDNGWINCSNFTVTDSNGKIYDDWIPAIRLFR